ncbi:MAG: hypothetical protein FD123_3085 [Bacteroidetes bacterium]|nr:MAG: hypothetical protein FD123_3085 [Bacteroidota bacterium]
MKKVTVLLCVLMLPFLTIPGQNLVPNPGFETYTSCPAAMIGEIFKATPWVNHLNSNDYFNVCGAASVLVPNNTLGNQPARTGNAYGGFIPVSGTVRECMRVPLTCMTAGVKKFLNPATRRIAGTEPAKTSH